MGSTRVARNAGTTQARVTTASKSSGTATKVQYDAEILEGGVDHDVLLLFHDNTGNERRIIRSMQSIRLALF